MKIYIRNEELLDEIEEAVLEAVNNTAQLEDALMEMEDHVQDLVNAGEIIEELLEGAVILEDEELPEGAVVLDTDQYGQWHNSSDLYGMETLELESLINDGYKVVPLTAEEQAQNAEREAGWKATRIANLKAELEALEA